MAVVNAATVEVNCLPEITAICDAAGLGLGPDIKLIS